MAGVSETKANSASSWAWQYHEAQLIYNTYCCVWWWWIFRDLEITKGGAARVFEGGDGHFFTQLRGYHYSQVLITIIAENNKRAGGVRMQCILYKPQYRLCPLDKNVSLFRH